MSNYKKITNDFSALNLQDLKDESWGIANVSIALMLACVISYNKAHLQRKG